MGLSTLSNSGDIPDLILNWYSDVAQPHLLC